MIYWSKLSTRPVEKRGQKSYARYSTQIVPNSLIVLVVVHLSVADAEASRNK